MQEYFNNNIYQNIDKKDKLADFESKITGIYKDLFQHIPPGKDAKGGYINISFVESVPEQSWKEQIKLRIIKAIEQLQDNNYRLKDIAILVRDKAEGKEIADFLIDYKNNEQISSKYKYDIISEELLYIRNAPSVQLIIAILKYHINPDDLLNKTFIVHEYLGYVKRKPENYDLHDLFGTYNKNVDSSGDFFPKELISCLKDLKSLSINDLVERITKRAGIDKKITPHTLRHTFASQMKSQGVDVYDLMELMGHTSIRTTANYIGTLVDDRKKDLVAQSAFNCEI